MIQAKVASAADLARLAELMVEFYAEASFTLAPDRAERAFGSLLDQPERGRVWLLEADGVPAGFVVLTLAYSMEYGALRGFVDDFFVRAEHRRHGLGALALSTVRDACVQLGALALLVEVGPQNRDGLSVYGRAGFTDTGHLLMKAELGAGLHGAAEQLDAADEARASSAGWRGSRS